MTTVISKAVNYSINENGDVNVSTPIESVAADYQYWRFRELPINIIEFIQIWSFEVDIFVSQNTEISIENNFRLIGEKPKFIDYVFRLFKYLPLISEEHLVPILISTIIYFRKFITEKPELMNINSVHFIFAVAFYLSIKMHDDFYIDKEDFQFLTGLNDSKVYFKAEVEFLKILDFNLSISDEEYQEIKSILSS